MPSDPVKRAHMRLAFPVINSLNMAWYPILMKKAYNEEQFNAVRLELQKISSLRTTNLRPLLFLSAQKILLNLISTYMCTLNASTCSRDQFTMTRFGPTWVSKTTPTFWIFSMRSGLDLNLKGLTWLQTRNHCTSTWKRALMRLWELRFNYTFPYITNNRYTLSYSINQNFGNKFML